MGKLISVKTTGNQFLRMLVPNLNINSFASNPKNVTFLEIFYPFAQKLTETTKQIPADPRESQLRPLIELDNKVFAIKYFANECRKQEKQLLKRKNCRKRVCDYKGHQIFLALSEAYLDAVHSIYDSIKEIDNLFGQNHADEIKKEQWFQIDMDLRNVFHHNQSPLLSVENEGILFTFERLPKNPKFLRSSMKDIQGKYHFSMSCKDMENDIINFLNKWAKNYLDLIDGEETTSIIVGHHKDGRIKSKAVALKDLLTIATKGPSI